MQAPMESKSKIVNTERIIRLVQKICMANMSAVLRPKNNPQLSIRASFRNIINRTGNSDGFLVLHNISERGLEKLPVGTVISTEIIGLATKVSFLTKIMAHFPGGVAVLIPRELLSVERRQAARFPIKANLASFLQFSKWWPEPNDFSAPPVFDLYRDVSGWISLGDISAAGCSIKMRFPSVLTVIETGFTDDQAILRLPLQPPMKVCVETRWQKRIKENVANSERQCLEFRVGILFVNPSSDVQMSIKAYIKQITVADAI